MAYVEYSKPLQKGDDGYAGEPPEVGASGYCTSTCDGYECCLTANHDSRHIAYGPDDQMFASWDDEDGQYVSE